MLVACHCQRVFGAAPLTARTYLGTASLPTQGTEMLHAGYATVFHSPMSSTLPGPAAGDDHHVAPMMGATSITAHGPAGSAVVQGSINLQHLSWQPFCSVLRCVEGINCTQHPGEALTGSPSKA